jgi:hypothetical protein
MARCTSISPLGTEFDSFLFAPIGQERDGILLSVVSALARLDLDPWLEAGELARLPREAATQRLAQLIASLPDASLPHGDPGTIAGALIARLPPRGSSAAPSIATWSGAEGTNSRVVLSVCVALMILTMGVQVFMATRVPQVQLDRAATHASGTVAPDVASPSSGRRGGTITGTQNAF